MQAEFARQLVDLPLGHTDLGPGLVVSFVGVRNDRVQAVVATGELYDHKDAVVLQPFDGCHALGLFTRQGDPGPMEEGRNRGGDGRQADEPGELTAVK